MKPGRAGTMTHDTSATGPPTCSPIATGEVLDCREHHTGKDVLRNLHVARNLDVVLDNLSWVPRSPTGWPTPNGALAPHFTPTSSSWLNIIERWFAHRPSLRRVHQRLIDAIEIAEHWNHDPEPFIWHKTHHKSPPRTSRPPPDQIRDAPLDTDQIRSVG